MNKTITKQLRITQLQDERIKEAAKIIGIKPSEFMRLALMDRAMKVIRDNKS